MCEGSVALYLVVIMERTVLAYLNIREMHHIVIFPSRSDPHDAGMLFHGGPLAMAATQSAISPRNDLEVCMGDCTFPKFLNLDQGKVDKMDSDSDRLRLSLLSLF
jgi:hypothetical protein